MKIKLILWVSLTLLLNGCVTVAKSPYHFSDSVKNLVKSSDVQIRINTEISRDFSRSQVAQAAGGGLLMALIDIGVNESRYDEGRESISQVTASITDDDLKQILFPHISKSLQSIEWLNISKSSAVLYQKEDAANSTGIDRDAIYMDTAKSQDVTVYVDCSISFSQDLSALKLVARVVAMPNRAGLKSFSQVPTEDEPNSLLNSIYLNDISASVPLTNIGTSDDIVAKLSSNRSQHFKQLLDRLAFDLSANIAKDMDKNTLRHALVYQPSHQGAPPKQIAPPRQDNNAIQVVKVEKASTLHMVQPKISESQTSASIPSSNTAPVEKPSKKPVIQQHSEPKSVVNNKSKGVHIIVWTTGEKGMEASVKSALNKINYPRTKINIKGVQNNYDWFHESESNAISKKICGQSDADILLGAFFQTTVTGAESYVSKSVEVSAYICNEQFKMEDSYQVFGDAEQTNPWSKSWTEAVTKFLHQYDPLRLSSNVALR